MSISALGANQVWTDLLWFIMENGLESSPRGQPIRELIGYQTTIDMSRPLVTLTDRKMGYKFAAAEAAWILSGDNRVETIAPFSREISKFSDDGETFFGAYGPKIVDQLPYVKSRLLEDIDTRQAVINIWRENPAPTKDTPCSLSVQFLIRNNKLHVIYTMRSSDAWLGWVYDVFNFTMLASQVLILLRQEYKDLTLGNLTLNAGSQHLYQRDFEKVEKLLNGNCEGANYPTWEPQCRYLEDSNEIVEDLWEAARGPGALWFLGA